MFNVAKARTDKDGVLQRLKYKGVAPVSLAYGCYLGESCDDNGNFKAFFLMVSFVSGTSQFLTPAEIRDSPRNVGISLENFPFSKKFSISDDLCDSLVAGEEYWFLYTSEPVSKPINGRMVTYEALDFVCVADVSGPGGLSTILPLLKFPLKQHQS
jgi:hypothetical protein